MAIAAADRRTIERALHDGVQQDLIAVATRVQLARRLVGSDAEATVALLDEIRREVHEALEGVRMLANDIYPSVLDARGLPDALRSAASALGVALTVVAATERYPADAEAAAYFSCRAVLEAVAAHADTRTTVTIRVDAADGELRIEVLADGVAPDAAAQLAPSVSVEPAGDRAVRFRARIPIL